MADPAHGPAPGGEHKEEAKGGKPTLTKGVLWAMVIVIGLLSYLGYNFYYNNAHGIPNTLSTLFYPTYVEQAVQSISQELKSTSSGQGAGSSGGSSGGDSSTPEKMDDPNKQKALPGNIITRHPWGSGGVGVMIALILLFLLFETRPGNNILTSLRGWNRRDPKWNKGNGSPPEIPNNDYGLIPTNLKKLKPHVPKKSLPDPTIELPPIDLTNYFIRIKNQLKLGACTAFATCAMLEYKIGRKRKSLWGVDLSELFVFHHAYGQIDWVLDFGKATGICKGPLWIYDTNKGHHTLQDKPSEAAYQDAPLQKIEDFERLAGGTTWTDLIIQALLDEDPCLIGIEVKESFKHYAGGTVTDLNGSTIGNHAVVVVGYHSHRKLKDGRKIPAFKIRNSWGSNWGEKGYVWVAKDVLEKILTQDPVIITGWKKDEGKEEKPAPRKPQDLLAEKIKEFVDKKEKINQLLGNALKSKKEIGRNLGVIQNKIKDIGFKEFKENYLPTLRARKVKKGGFEKLTEQEEAINDFYSLNRKIVAYLTYLIAFENYVLNLLGGIEGILGTFIKREEELTHAKTSLKSIQNSSETIAKAAGAALSLSKTEELSMFRLKSLLSKDLLEKRVTEQWLTAEIKGENELQSLLNAKEKLLQEIQEKLEGEIKSSKELLGLIENQKGTEKEDEAQRKKEEKEKEKQKGDEKPQEDEKAKHEEKKEKEPEAGPTPAPKISIAINYPQGDKPISINSSVGRLQATVSGVNPKFIGKENQYELLWSIRPKIPRGEQKEVIIGEGLLTEIKGKFGDIKGITEWFADQSSMTVELVASLVEMKALTLPDTKYQSIIGVGVRELKIIREEEKPKEKEEPKPKPTPAPAPAPPKTAPTGKLGKDFLEENRGKIRFSYEDNPGHPKWLKPTVDDLIELNLGPLTSLEYQGKNYYLSPSFKFNGYPSMVLYYDHKDGTIYARCLYKSNSAAVWRTLSHYLSADRGWYGKGIEHEESVVYPHPLQPMFESQWKPHFSHLKTKTLTDGTVRNNSEFIFLGLATHGKGWYGFKKSFSLYNPKKIEIGKFEGEIPESYKFIPGFEPEFNKLEKFKPMFSSCFSADCDTYLCPSVNGQLSFLFFLEPKLNRAWIGSIQVTEFRPNLYGTNTNIVSLASIVQNKLLTDKTYVKTNHLVCPAAEYSNQIPPLPGVTYESFGGSYSDAGPYVERLPVIREFRKKIEVPAPFEIPPIPSEGLSPKPKEPEILIAERKKRRDPEIVNEVEIMRKKCDHPLSKGLPENPIIIDIVNRKITLDKADELYTSEMKGYSLHPKSNKKTDIGAATGWKFHLNVTPKNVKEVSGYLTSKEYYHKFLSGGEIEDGKIFTVYIGSRDKAEEEAQNLSKDLAQYLSMPVEHGEIEFAPGVVGRFDASNARMTFHQYGGFGLVWLLEDLDNLKYLFYEPSEKKTPPPSERTAEQKKLEDEFKGYMAYRSFIKLKEYYGDYFLGTKGKKKEAPEPKEKKDGGKPEPKPPTSKGETETFATLRKLDAKSIASILANEQPQTVAIVLSYLHPDQAADALSAFPRETQAKVVELIAYLQEIPDDKFRKIEYAIEEKAKDFISRKSAPQSKSAKKIISEEKPEPKERLVKTSSLKGLFAKIRNGGGYGLQVHGGHRFDLNDWGKDEMDYVRAVYNIKMPPGAPFRVADHQLPSVDLPRDQQPDALYYGPIKDVSKKKEWKLSELLQRGDGEDAFFLSIIFHADIGNEGQPLPGRKMLNPEITILGNQEVVLEAENYIQAHPAELLEFIKMLFPKKEFPNVNKGIIEKINLTKKLLIVDFRNFPYTPGKGYSVEVCRNNSITLQLP
ncbi:hypothetical protein HYU14_06085 [Candidatus Woesearchaeota archaeon]|nr:hypothetical protein [Candidatus Woesearchaeota archaeon]